MVLKYVSFKLDKICTIEFHIFALLNFIPMRKLQMVDLKVNMKNKRK